MIFYEQINGFLFEHVIIMSFFASLLVFLSNFFACLFLLLKVFKLICYTKVTISQLPVLNPYTWPFAFPRIATRFYFRFWRRALPPVRLSGVTLNLSIFMSLEVLKCLLFVTGSLRMFTLETAQSIIQTYIPS
jgi:hypothetical protein